MACWSVWTALLTASSVGSAPIACVSEESRAVCSPSQGGAQRGDGRSGTHESVAGSHTGPLRWQPPHLRHLLLSDV
eukprot:5117786-Prymnesium_polylepis.1